MCAVCAACRLCRGVRGGHRHQDEPVLGTHVHRALCPGKAEGCVAGTAPRSGAAGGACPLLGILCAVFRGPHFLWSLSRCCTTFMLNSVPFY